MRSTSLRELEEALKRNALAWRILHDIYFQKMDTIVSPTLDLAEIRPKNSEAAQHSKLTHI